MRFLSLNIDQNCCEFQEYVNRNNKSNLWVLEHMMYFKVYRRIRSFCLYGVNFVFVSECDRDLQGLESLGLEGVLYEVGHF